MAMFTDLIHVAIRHLLVRVCPVALTGMVLQTAAVAAMAPLDAGVDTQATLPCEEKAWRNPLIDVDQDTILLRSRSSSKPRRLSVDELPAALEELKASDWPYGRIIALPSSINPHVNDTPRDVLAALHRSVMRAGIFSVWFWPSPAGQCANGRRAMPFPPQP